MQARSTSSSNVGLHNPSRMPRHTYNNAGTAVDASAYVCKQFVSMSFGLAV